jgi:hypothetical protein
VIAPEGAAKLWGSGLMLMPKTGGACVFSTYDTTTYMRVIQLLESHDVRLVRGIHEYRRMRKAR